MRAIWQRSICLALVGSLLAPPAMAGGHKHGRGCGHGHHGRDSYRGGWGYQPYWGPPPRHHHHHHDNGVDAGDILLATAVGIGVVALWTAAQQQADANAQYRAFAGPVGQPVAWNEDGAGGSVVALSEGYADTGEYCREFQKEIVVGGRRESGYGIACRQPDGSWRVGQ
jgi:surface antigen